MAQFDSLGALSLARTASLVCPGYVLAAPCPVPEHSRMLCVIALQASVIAL